MATEWRDDGDQERAAAPSGIVGAPGLSATGPAGSKRVRELLEWIEIPSVSGDETQMTDRLARSIEARGLDLMRIAVGAEGRAALVGCAGVPRVVLCTHLDTVPPWFGGRADRQFVHGRGACDAKGVALAMLEAVDLLLADGLDEVGLLFTVGEEVDSDGARAANAWLESGPEVMGSGPEFVVVGEPTSNRFVRGHKGMLRASLEARGVAAHSSQPAGPSAIHDLVHSCSALLGASWGEHPLFGTGTVNIGTIEGGVADNVVAERARAEFLVRSVRGPEQDQAGARACLCGGTALEVHTAYAPVEFLVPDGEPAEVVPFGTDAPYLGAFGRPLLIGPGDIAVAHTEHERIAIRELDAGVARYAAVVRDLLGRG